jgi:CubicO group peptidase (beta-lactamase class C family)
MMRTHLRTLALLAVPAALSAQQRDLGATADSIFARWNSTHTPGCAVGVSRAGKTLLQRGYGMANLETGTPITPATIFESGSVAKQFTAAAVMLLVQDGKLSLDDPVRKFFPEMPEYDKPITIHHLLTHTSGLRDWGSVVAWSGWPRGTRAHTQADLLDVAFRQRALNYSPGEYYSYTNTGYAVAMSLVERVSGKSFGEFTRERIFTPLGLHDTSWRTDFTTLVPGRAQAYSRAADGWHLDTPFENVVGPGGMLTTVGDWLEWNDALTARRLGAVTDSLERRMRLNSGREIQYAHGVSQLRYRGLREISHSGSTGGYTTYLARYPDRQLSIAVLCNAAQASPGPAVRQLASAIITDFPVTPATDSGRADPASVQPFFGMYRNDRTRSPLVVNAEAATYMRLLSSGSYLYANNTRWQFTNAGGVIRLRIAQADSDTVTYTHVGQRWAPTRSELQGLEGRYRSDEIEATYTVRLVGDSLTLSGRRGPARTLVPAYRDAFTRGGSTIWFTRDRSDKVTAMHVGEARMWDLVLSRIP